MMNFATPHAILVERSNFTEILHTVPIQYEALYDIYQDSLREGMRYYIVGERNPITGFPMWEPFTEVEFAIEYRLKSTKKFESTFRKIVPNE